MSGAAVGGPHPAAAGPAGVFPPQGRDSAGVFTQSGETSREVFLQDSRPEVRLSYICLHVQERFTKNKIVI